MSRRVFPLRRRQTWLVCKLFNLLASSISITKVLSPLRRVIPSLCSFWRCTLMKPAQFLVTALDPTSMGSEYHVPSATFILQSCSMHAPLASLWLMLLKPISNQKVMWKLSKKLLSFLTLYWFGIYVKWRWYPNTMFICSLGKSFVDAWKGFLQCMEFDDFVQGVYMLWNSMMTSVSLIFSNFYEWESLATWVTWCQY